MCNNLVFYHAECHDGFTAAWAAWKSLGSFAMYLPTAYGEILPSCRDVHVYLLDYCPDDPAELTRLANEAASLTVIDHHADKKEALERLRGTGPTIVFDTSHSGAWLTWYHFHQEPPPPLVLYIEDQDLSRWGMPNSREYNAAIQSVPYDFLAWTSVSNRPSYEIVQEGKSIIRYKERLVERATKQAVEVEIAGQRILAANTPLLMPEVALELSRNRPFGMAWMVRSDGLVQVSLRSSNGFDVSKVAAMYGGGGHPTSAGFQFKWQSWPHDPSRLPTKSS